MAENEFDQTVKLSAGEAKPPSQTQPVQVPPAAGQPAPAKPAEADKTVKLSPQDDKTVKLSAAAPPPASPTPPPPPPKKQPAPPAPAFMPAPSRASGMGRLIGILAGVVVALLLAGSWFLLPGWLKGQAAGLSEAGNHQEAAKKLKLAVSLFPLGKESYLASYGKELRLTKDYANAQKALEAVLAKKPDDYEAQKELGLTFNESGQKEKALEAFRKCVEANPGDYEVLKTAGTVAFELKDYNAAASFLEKAAKAGQAGAEDWHRLGVSYYELGKIEGAADALIQASEKNKSLKGVHGLLAKIYLSQERFDEALGLAKLELSLSPNDAALADAVADSAGQAGTNAASKKKWSEAVQFYEEGLSVPSKKSGELHYALARTFAQLKKKKEALDHLGEAIQKDPQIKSKARTDRAFVLLRKSLVYQKIVK